MPNSFEPGTACEMALGLLLLALHPWVYLLETEFVMSNDMLAERLPSSSFVT
jgi:hypothetical protein